MVERKGKERDESGEMKSHLPLYPIGKCETFTSTVTIFSAPTTIIFFGLSMSLLNDQKQPHWWKCTSRTGICVAAQCYNYTA